MKFKIKKIDYGGGNVHYVVLKRNQLGLYVKFFYKIDGSYIHSYSDICIEQFSQKILYLTDMSFSKYIVLEHRFGYSVLDYFTDIHAAKYFIDLVIRYNEKK